MVLYYRGDSIINLNSSQKEAILHRDGPGLVLAVPGAGKTTVIIHRTNNLISKESVGEENILTITFSKAAAMDMKSRFNTSFPNHRSKVNFSTIHSFSYSILNDYARKNGIRYRLIEGHPVYNKYKILKDIYMSVNNQHITEDKLEGLINSIGYVKNTLIKPEDYQANGQAKVENFPNLYRSYEAFKNKNHLIDFDDMLDLAYKALINDRDIRQSYQKRYKYIQVDEGQDTSKLQMEIIKLVALPENNLFIVADDDQSIYGFRGAMPKGLFKFKDEFKAKLYFMEENYRSQDNIVSLSNKLIKNNKLRYNKNIYTKNPKLDPVNLVYLDNVCQQYSYISREISARPDLSTGILYRNNISSIGLINQLVADGIDFKLKEVNMKFFNHWILEDITNFLKFSLNPYDLEAYQGIFYKTKGYISRNHIDYASSNKYKLKVIDRIRSYPGLPYYYKSNLDELARDFNILSSLKIDRAIDFILINMEYDDYLREASIKFGHSDNYLNAIVYYLKLIGKNLTSLDEFLARINLLKDHSYRSLKENSNVYLSTMHGSKGLEFDRVFVIDLINDDFPSLHSLNESLAGNHSYLEEERRLFYVAITRARKFLTLFNVDKLGRKLVQPSIFTKEIE